MESPPVSIACRIAFRPRIDIATPQTRLILSV
jgi:hypothetical protein